MSAKAAVNRGGEVTDEQGALHQVLAAPFGSLSRSAKTWVLPFGPWILVLIAVRITAYGIYTLIEARCRQLAT